MFVPLTLRDGSPAPLGDSVQDTPRFEALLDRCERWDVRRLPFDELREIGRLYRLHTARLARLRAHDDDPEVVRHLNALCVRAYSFLYADPAAAAARERLNLASLQNLLGRTWHAQRFATLLLLMGMLLGGVLAARDPQAQAALLEPMYADEAVERLATSPAARQRFFEREATPVSMNLFFGSALFAHNTRVGLLAFATGMLAGIPTVLLQLYNGLMLGAFAALFLRDPWPIQFFAWILPHGIPELTAITLCAAGGLLLGEAVAAPGRRGRRAALRDAVPAALLLFLGALPLLALAALLESFVRESALGTVPRLMIAGLMLGGLIAGFVGVARLGRRATADSSWLRDLTTPIHSVSPDSGSAPIR